MLYRAMGWIHHNTTRLWQERTGQGTVEYVGLMLLMATLLVGVVAAGKSVKGGEIANILVAKLKDAITSVGAAK